MELRLVRETIPASVRIFDGVQEQGAELDYILPDYYPDIFRIVRCEAVPVITDHAVSGDRLTYELRCDMRILYCSEDSSVLQCITQQQTFTKTAELGASAADPEITVSAKTDHVTFRAVNKRRLDVRAAVSVKITAVGQREQEVISDADGMNIQLKKVPVRYAAGRLMAEKHIQLSDDIDLSAAQPDITGIISSRCSCSDCEVKLISGKLLAKGEADVELLYSCEKEGSGGVEPMSFSLPYSQIIDLDGVDDSYDCTVKAEVISCEASPAPDPAGDNRVLRCQLELRLCCTAARSASVMVVSDAYSTVYPCEIELSDISAEQIPAVYTESFRHNAKICSGESVPETVYAMWCSPRNINARISEDGRSAVISGMLTYSMAARDSSGMMIMTDRDETFEENVQLGEEVSASSVRAEITAGSVSYTIGSDGVLSARSDISARISVYSAADIKAVTDISVDDSSRKERDGDYAVKLYYGVENEDIWDIAKRCSTSVAAITEENDLSGDKLTAGGMLLIPITE